MWTAIQYHDTYFQKNCQWKLTYLVLGDGRKGEKKKEEHAFIHLFDWKVIRFQPEKSMLTWKYNEKCGIWFAIQSPDSRIKSIIHAVIFILKHSYCVIRSMNISSWFCSKKDGKESALLLKCSFNIGNIRLSFQGGKRKTGTKSQKFPRWKSFSSLWIE